VCHSQDVAKSAFEEWLKVKKEQQKQEAKNEQEREKDVQQETKKRSKKEAERAFKKYTDIFVVTQHSHRFTMRRHASAVSK